MMMLDDNDSLEKEMIETKIDEVQAHNSKLIKRLVTNISEQQIYRCQMTEVSREQLIEDEYDFKEFREKFSNHSLISDN
jgi:hypothetical protein